MEIRFSQLWQSLRTMTYPHCYWTASNKFSYNSSCYNYLLEFKWMFRIIFKSNLNCFNLDIYCIVCVKSIFFIKVLTYIIPSSKLKIWNLRLLGKVTNITKILQIHSLHGFCTNFFGTYELQMYSIVCSKTLSSCLCPK